MRKKKCHRALQQAIARAIDPYWSSLVVMSAALPLAPAFAVDECGAHVAGVPLVCDATNNPYPNGIVYDTVNGDVELTIESGTVIQRPAGYNNDGADIYSDGVAFNITVEDGVTIDVSGAATDGIVVTGTRDVFIDSGANISAGFSGLHGIVRAHGAGDVHVSQRASGSIEITNGGGAAVWAENDGIGSATATSAGRIEFNIDDVWGLYAYVDQDGDATAHLTASGSIELSGDLGIGIRTDNQSSGSSHALADGSIVLTGDDSIGLSSLSSGASAGAEAVAELSATGTVSATGANSVGAEARSSGLGVARVQSFGAVTLSGLNSTGLMAEITNAGSAAAATVTVGGNGSVETTADGGAAVSVLNAGSGASTIELQSNARLTTRGVAAHGASGVSSGLLSLIQSQAATIDVSGAESIGVNMVGGSNTTLQLDGVVSALGEYGVGAVSVAATGTAQQIIGSTATVRGGWQNDVAGFGPATGYQATGVLLDGGNSAHLSNAGTIGAASDRAVFAHGGAVTVDNSGTITGFVELSGGGVNIFNNAPQGTFEVRHHADTDGDGSRDLNRVAKSDFGGTSSTFNNASGALVKLASVPSTLGTDATGYYVPTTGVDERSLDGSVYRLNRAGIVQGQFVNLGTFNHAGVIDLRGPVTGNTLVITGSASAGGAPGSGVFVSNGGSLSMNVVLNEGLAPNGHSGSVADVLVVDGTQLGSGATTITLDRKEGAGAATPGNGILLVEVRDKARSAPDVFTLNGDYTHNGMSSVVMGAYAYSLHHNGEGADAADGNWYLRSSALDLDPPDTTPPPDPTPSDPTPPDPTPPDPVAPPPRFQPGVPLYESYTTNLQALNRLPTLQQRVGDRVGSVNADSGSSGAWGRTYGAGSRVRASTSTTGAEQSVDSWKMQLGLDRVLSTSEDGDRLVASIAVDYGSADSTVRSIMGNGQIDTKGYGVGTMWTWYGHTGVYVDVQAQLNRYESDLHSPLLGRLVHANDGRGKAFSLEMGKSVQLDGDWSITPQAQLSYSSVRFDRFVDTVDAVVSTHDADSLISRVGIAVNRDHAAQDRRTHLYAIVNLSYEWENELRTQVSGIEINRLDRREWGELGFGASVNWSNGVRLYGEVSGKSQLRDIAHSYTLHGVAGISMQF